MNQKTSSRRTAAGFIMRGRIINVSIKIVNVSMNIINVSVNFVNVSSKIINVFGFNRSSS